MKEEDVLSHVKVEETNDKTHLFFVVIDNVNNKNVKPLLSSAAHAYVKLGGYSYSIKDDCFNILCNEYIDLGIIHRGITVTVDGFRQRLPIPEKYIECLLNEVQKKHIEAFRCKYPSDTKRFLFKFVQFVPAN